ncbi:MAG: hypothetical protein Q9169_001003 [Polycauliona sp. 2 TL-2023]
MGAIHKLDLTSDVTHLIVGDADTPKYKFVAKERPDVKCLLPTWVEALRELWMEGGEPDVQALESRHALPALHKLRICVTGFEDMDYRKKLEDLVNVNGGEYRANLTKDVTHLIAKEASGAKYKYAIDWNIKIVAVEWLAQTLERGMILDEKLYSLFTPPAERGRDAWIRRTVSASSLGKRMFDGDIAASGPRKLRRVASTKLSNQNVGLWTDIVSADVQAEKPKRDQWSEQPARRESSLQGTSSTTATSEGMWSDGPPRSSATTVKTPVPPPVAKPLPKMGIFAGKKLCLHGFGEKKTAVLHKHLLSHGADILPDSLSFTQSTASPVDNEFFLVPHDTPRHQIPPLPDTIQPPTVVTDMWIERCMLQKQYVLPEANVTNTPFPRFPLPGFEQLTICATNFEGADRLHISKAVKLMGAAYDEEFTAEASVLICRQVVEGQEKTVYARQWQIPMVTVEWLWDSITSAGSQPFEPYLAQSRLKKPALGAQKQAMGPGEIKIERNTAASEHKSAVLDATPHVGSKLKSTTSEAKCNDDEPNSDDTSLKHETNDTPKSSPPQSEPPKPPLPQPPPPLQEISPNSSPPKPSTTTTSPSKSHPLIKPLSTDSSLSSAISSLLAHHQNARSSGGPSVAAAQNPPPRPHVRRKRQLFGRAPSNASNLSLSRASSVDTVNTDGVGTPVEPTHSFTIDRQRNSASVPTTNNRTAAHHEDDTNTSTNSNLNPLLLSHYPSDEDERQRRETQSLHDQQLQMTQLGYEDPDALAWREKVARKLGGSSGVDSEAGGRRRVRETGVVKDVVMGRAAPVGKRTRLAAAAGVER